MSEEVSTTDESTESQGVPAKQVVAPGKRDRPKRGTPKGKVQPEPLDTPTKVEKLASGLKITHR